MTVKKLGISMDARLAEEIAAYADAEGKSISGWITEAVASRVRSRRLGELVDEYEATFGPIPQSELAEVDRLWPA